MKRWSFASLFVLPMLIQAGEPIRPSQDRVLKVGKPEQVGMSVRRLEIVNQILTDETKSGA